MKRRQARTYAKQKKVKGVGLPIGWSRMGREEYLVWLRKMCAPCNPTKDTP